MDEIMANTLNYFLAMIGAGVLVGLTWAVFFSWVKW